MSELKAYRPIELVMQGRHNEPIYLKSEADKVIADLEESHKKEVGQLLMAIVELKKEKEYVVEQTAEVINGQERELRHHKYKRCLAMANACKDKIKYWHIRYTTAAGYDRSYEKRKHKLFIKWCKRWLAIAENFEPNSTAQ